MERTKKPKGKPPTLKSNENRSLLTAGIWDKLMEQEYAHDCIILYGFYRRIAFEKKTDLFWANRGYCIKGSKLSRDRFDRAKKVLERLKLIEEVPQVRKNGMFSPIKIKINYMWEDIDNIENNGKTEFHTIKGKAPRITKNRTRPNNGRTPRITETRNTETRNTNTLKKYSINTKETKLIYEAFLTEGSEGFPKQWLESAPFKIAVRRWIYHLQERGKGYTPSQVEQEVRGLVKEYDSPGKLIDAINFSIRRGWLSIYPKPEPKNKDICPIKNWVFGKSFSTKQGCRDCEDHHNSLYRRCELAHEKLINKPIKLK